MVDVDFHCRGDGSGGWGGNLAGGKGIDAMAKRWMQGAVRRRGALMRKAQAAGMTPIAFARKHAHDSGPRGSEELRTGEEARFALIAQHVPIPPKGKTRHAHLPRAARRQER